MGRPLALGQLAPLLRGQRLEERFVVQDRQRAFHLRILRQTRAVGRSRNQLHHGRPARGRDEDLFARRRFDHDSGQVGLVFFQSDCHAATLTGC